MGEQEWLGEQGLVVHLGIVIVGVQLDRCRYDYYKMNYEIIGHIIINSPRTDKRENEEGQKEIGKEESWNESRNIKIKGGKTSSLIEKRRIVLKTILNALIYILY